VGNRRVRAEITKTGLALYGVMIFLLFYGLAQSELEPGSWLGRLTSSTFGRFAYGAALCVPFYIVERMLARYGHRTIRRPTRGDV